MKTFPFALLLTPALCWSQATAEPAPSARELRAANCVAALDTQTRSLANQVKAGNEGVRGLLGDRLTAGSAFVGDAYRRGERDEAAAKQLAEEARQRQKRLSARELAALQTSCAEEGARLYAAANALERMVVKRVAKNRMERLLESAGQS